MGPPMYDNDSPIWKISLSSFNSLFRFRLLLWQLLAQLHEKFSAMMGPTAPSCQTFTCRAQKTIQRRFRRRVREVDKPRFERLRNFAMILLLAVSVCVARPVPCSPGRISGRRRQHQSVRVRRQPVLRLDGKSRPSAAPRRPDGLVLLRRLQPGALQQQDSLWR